MKSISSCLNSAVCYALIVGTTLLVSHSSAHAQQCNDKVDNDGDGRIDALVELDPNNRITFTFGGSSTSSEVMRAAVAANIRDKKLNMVPPSAPIVRSDTGWDTVANPGIDNRFQIAGLNAVCRSFGYGYHTASTCRDDERTPHRYPYGKCNYHSPRDNQLSRFAGNGFYAETALEKFSKTWLTGITCQNLLSACNDGVDNDNDGKTDLADDGCANANDNSEIPHDPACTSPAGTTEFEQCRDGIDNDGDGAVDLADFSCSGPNDNDETNGKSACQDGVDNDNDGLVDRADPGCSSNQDNNEGDGTSQCQDGVDNDGDGATDFPADFSCSSRTDTDETNPKSGCQDGVDNDNDGLVDRADPGCSSNQDNNEGDGTSQCQDGVDNDGDGATDFPADFSCSSRTDTDETNPKSGCQDGVDNDNDGLVDRADPGCSSNQDNNEGDGTSQCQDGVDNDSDGATDFPADFSCSSKTDTDEGNPRSACQDGVDNDNDGLIDRADPGCSSNQDNNEGDGTSQCQDKIDNDSDGAIDFPADFSCSSKTDADETNPKSECQDGIDNDSDGLIDLIDPGCSSNQDNNESDGSSQCQNGLDDDKDGLVDLADPGCSNPQDNNEGDGTSQCQDSIDNDKDGATDFPADFSCTNAQDNDEGNPKSGCQDGVDNDSDGLTDLADPGCTSNQDNNEGDGSSQCQNKIDDDNDGLIDSADPGCSNPTDNNESDGTSQCQDKTDNDLDGLIDLVDPGCSNAQDNNEVDDVSRLQVTTECVYDNLNGTFTAYFGYDNRLGVDTVVVNDAPRGTSNVVTPTTTSQVVPTTFKSGRQKGVLSVVFSSGSVAWTVQIAPGVRSTATASLQSPKCTPVVPVAECIDGTQDGLKGTFGYVNSNEFEIKVPLGSRNLFAPTPADRGQPNSFFAGTNRGVFTANFKDQVQWTVGSITVSLNSASPVCTGGCVGTSTANIKGNLDSVALKLSELTKQAAKFLQSQAQIRLKGEAASKVSRDVVRSQKRADDFVKLANSLTVQFPAVVKACPNAAQLCSTVDRGAVIDGLRGLYAQQRNSVRRIIARGYFNSSGRTSRTDRIVAEAKAAEESGAASLAKLPRFATECK